MEKLTPEEKINIDFLKSQLKEKQEIIDIQFKEIEKLKLMLNIKIDAYNSALSFVMEENKKLELKIKDWEDKKNV